MTERKFILTFSRELANSPVTFNLARDHLIDVNILRAEIDEMGGRMILSMSGESGELRKAIAFLEKENVRVRELDQYVVLDASRCIDCSMCTSICPVRAYRLDRETWHVHFDYEKCIACGLCVDACPSRALSKSKAAQEMA